MVQAFDTRSLSNGSSHSTTPNSPSTYEYSHEPFDSFRHKVEALNDHIGVKFIDNITRLPGGDFNRTIAADLHSHDQAFAVQKVILRIPRYVHDKSLPHQDILDQCFILRAIANSGIHGPRVFAYDCTSNNALGMPFSLQTRLEGQALHLAYGDMTTPERLSTANELVRMLAVMENVKFQSPGRLSCSGALRLQLFGYPTGQGLWCWRCLIQNEVNCPTSLQELLSTRLDGWLQRELSNDPGSFMADIYERLKDIQTEMNELGFFEDRASLGSNVLYHWNLEPRNIIVERKTTVPSSDASETNHVQIIGVLNWDDALSVLNTGTMP
ncbi:hypothetical protein KCU85_g2713, partial [Aureobasidium melanogenum]